MKRSILLATLVLSALAAFAPMAFAANEICNTDVNTCCVAPDIVGDCPTGTVWIGSPAGERGCEAPTTCAGQKFNCQTNSCVPAAAPVTSGTTPTCSGSQVHIGNNVCKDVLKVFNDSTPAIPSTIDKLWLNSILGRIVYVPDTICKTGQAPVYDDKGTLADTTDDVWACGFAEGLWKTFGPALNQGIQQNFADYPGNVGIGGTGASFKLDVYKEERIYNTAVASTADLWMWTATKAYRFLADQSGNFFANYYPDNTNATNVTRLAIDSTGNVGIGTTGPGTKLDVAGTSRVLGPVAWPTSGSGLLLSYDSASNMGYLFPINSGTSVYGNLYLGNGNVGIGTTTPDKKLSVAGSISTDDYLYHNGDDNTYMGFSADDTIKLVTGGVDRMTILSGGRVGIGTSPGSMFHVGDGWAKFNWGIIIGSSTTPNINAGRHMSQATSAGSYGYFQVRNSADQIGANFGIGNGGDLVEIQLDVAEKLGITGGDVIVGATGTHANLTVYGNINVGDPTSCFGPVFEDASEASSNGSGGGYEGTNGACAGSVDGTHVCTTSEMLNSINCGRAPSSGTSNLWISNGAPSLPTPTNDCNGWTSGDSAWKGIKWVYSDNGGSFYAESCNVAHNFACCK